MRISCAIRIIVDMQNKITHAVFIIIIALSPLITNAKIIINEIMYDPEGTDTGREWIEIYNDSTTDVDLAAMRLNENGVNHTMKPINAPTAILGAGKYAIVADSAEKFLLDYTNYSDLLIDSAFSLNNTGESIAFVDAEGNVIDTVTYSLEWGAGGNGNSLQRRGDVWIPGEVTLAKENITVPADESEDDSGNSATSTSSGSSSSGSTSNISAHSSQSILTTYKPKINLEIGIGRDRIGFVNTPIEFHANHNQEKNTGIKYLWSFGDGDSATGNKIKHAYYSSGEYNVVTNAAKSGEQAVSRIKVAIKEPGIVITASNRGKLVDILLENRSAFEVNVGGFEITKKGEIGSKTFIFPQDTIINSGKAVNIMGEISGLVVENQTENLSLQYPNGRTLSESVLVIDPSSFQQIELDREKASKNKKTNKKKK